MKRIILLVVLVIGIIAATQAQIDIKGYKLGMKSSKYVSIRTTVAKIQGYLTMKTLNDGTTYQIEFVSDNTYINTYQDYWEDGSVIDRSNLISIVESKYNIKLKIEESYIHENESIWSCTWSNEKYVIDLNIFHRCHYYDSGNGFGTVDKDTMDHFTLSIYSVKLGKKRFSERDSDI